MNFSKVKLVIILCLAVFNVLLGILCVRLVYDNSYIPEEETELAEKHLSKIGIQVEFSADLRKKSNLPVYTAYISDEEEVPEIYKNITEAFFNISVNSEDYVTIPGGYSVSVKDKEGNTVGTSSLDGNMLFECAYENALTDINIQQVSSNFYSTTLQKNENKNAEKIAERFVKKSFRGSEAEYVKKGCTAYNGGHVVYFVGSISDAEITDLYVNVFVKDNKPIYCFGSILNNAPQKKYSAKLMDSVNILYHLADILKTDSEGVQPDITVSEMTMSYRMIQREASDYYIIPAWLIEYYDDSGVKNVISIDAIAGENGYVLAG